MTSSAPPVSKPCEDRWIGLSRGVMSSLSRGVCRSQHPAGALGRAENMLIGEESNAEASRLPGKAGGESPGPHPPRGAMGADSEHWAPSSEGQVPQELGACAGLPGTS